MKDFNKALLEINAEVLKKYPTAAFHEAQGYLVPNNSIGCKVDGTINENSFKVAYSANDSGPMTIIGSYDENGNVKIEEIHDIWIEDYIMTPYVPIIAQDAIRILCKELGNDAIGEGSITLRHQLFYGESEPRYFFGGFTNTHTVGVYTGRVDVPAGHDRVTKLVNKVKKFLNTIFLNDRT